MPKKDQPVHPAAGEREAPTPGVGSTPGESPSPGERPTPGRQPVQRVVLPVMAETIRVDKRPVVTGKVVVRKIAHERREVVDLPLAQEHIIVERTLINRIVDAPVQVRQEGNVTIIPVLEEELVVEKRLILKEELRITRERVVTHQPREVTVVREEARVERVEVPEESEQREAS